MNTKASIHPKKILAIIIIILTTGLILFALNLNQAPSITDQLSPLLTINSDKAHYLTGEQVYFQITSLDTKGKVFCHSNLELTATNSQLPNSNFQIPVSISPTCNPHSDSSLNPDYTAFFQPNQPGPYLIRIIDKDRNLFNQTTINVSSKLPDITITRWSATRIDVSDNNRYPMVITIKSRQKFSGTITDSLPAGFDFAWYGEGLVAEVDGRKSISWNINLEPETAIELKYDYIPKITDHCVFNFGPLVNSGKTLDSVWQVTPGAHCLTKIRPKQTSTNHPLTYIIFI